MSNERPARRQFVRETVVGAVAILYFGLLGITSAEVIGPDLISRSTIDPGKDYLFLYDGTPGFTSPGIVQTWSFFNDNGSAQAGRTLEPVLLKQVGDGWLVTGVGATVTTPATMNGVQTFDFNLVAGSPVVGPGYTFAHRDWTAGGSIEFDRPSPGTGTHRYLLRDTASEIPGAALSGFSGADRVYSVQFSTAEKLLTTVGNQLIDRTGNDGASGAVFMDTHELPGPGQLLEWAFFDNDDLQNPNRQITPLILQKVGGDYLISGVGTTRTTTELGEQHYLFDLVAGSDLVGPGYYLGWKDGSPTADNMGVIDYNTNGNLVDGIRVFASVSPTVDLNLGAGTFYGRDYSIQATVMLPEPGTIVLLAGGALGLGWWTMRRR